jgi:hypothetical protein
MEITMKKIIEGNSAVTRHLTDLPMDAVPVSESRFPNALFPASMKILDIECVVWMSMK